MSEILARLVLRNSHLRKPHDKQTVPAKKRGIWQENVQARSRRQSYVLLFCGRRQRHRRSYVCYGFGSFNALSSDEMDTLRRSRNLFKVLTANGEVQTNEDAQVYVHDLNMFVKVSFLDDTPPILLLHQLC